MNPDIKTIAEYISRHEFEKAYEYFSDDITWELIGGETKKGKKDVLSLCNESHTYLQSVKTTFTKFRSEVLQNTVIIESSAEYLDEKQEKSVVSSCDIYRFNDGKLQEIVSYNIEIPQT